MRIDTNDKNQNSNLSAQNESVIQRYKSKLEKLTVMTPMTVMLGDNTLTKQDTFRPDEVVEYFNNVTAKLPDWDIQETTQTRDKDLRRIFTKFQIREDDYRLSCHLSIQFHVLLYYKVDKSVAEYQKRLEKITKDIGDSEEKYAQISDALVKDKLNKQGMDEIKEDQLFEMLFKDTELQESLENDIKKLAGDKLNNLIRERKEVLDGLDRLLVETYQTTSVLIDENRLVAGEEGILYTLDQDIMKNDQWHGMIESKDISEKNYNALSDRIKEIYNALEV